MSFINTFNKAKNPPPKSFAAAAAGGHATSSSKHNTAKSQKRTNQEVLDHLDSLSKRQNVVLGPQYLQFIEKYGLWKNLSHAYPKSSVEHGVRVMFNTKFPVELERISAAFDDQYPAHTFVEPKYTKGYIDVGFRTASEADAAAIKPFVVKISGLDQYIPVTRTRYNKDNCIFLSFENLPSRFLRKEVEDALQEGLRTYGEVVQFVYQKHHLFPSAATSKAIALIKPSQVIQKDISLIPRRAVLKIGDECAEIKVFPESAPPICSLCTCIGHRQTACPSSVEGLIREEENTMGEEAEEHLADTAFTWGHTTQYKKVSPVTNQEKKAAAKALQDAKARAEQEKMEVEENVNSDQTGQSFIPQTGPVPPQNHENFNGPNGQTPQTPNFANQHCETNHSMNEHDTNFPLAGSMHGLNQNSAQSTHQNFSSVPNISLANPMPEENQNSFQYPPQTFSHIPETPMPETYQSGPMTNQEPKRAEESDPQAKPSLGQRILKDSGKFIPKQPETIVTRAKAKASKDTNLADTPLNEEQLA